MATKAIDWTVEDKSLRMQLMKLSKPQLTKLCKTKRVPAKPSKLEMVNALIEKNQKRKQKIEEKKKNMEKEKQRKAKNRPSSKLLIIGYIHQNITKQIPSDVIITILSFYPKNYKLYAIGYEADKRFGIALQSGNNQWQYLYEMSSLCHDSNLISSGSRNFFIINFERDELYGIGNNDFGALGINRQSWGAEYIYEFTKLQFDDIDLDKYSLDFVSQGCSDGWFSFIVFRNRYNSDEQIIYSFGKNGPTQQQGFESQSIKHSKYNSRDIYAPLRNNTLNQLFSGIKIVQITCGYRHALFLAHNGSVYSCGAIGFGQCGTGRHPHENAFCKPQIIPTLKDIICIASGLWFNLCMDKNNAVWVFGRNSDQQLGLGKDYRDTQYIDKPMINPYLCGDYEDNKIVFIDCGSAYSMCINKKGKVFMFGDNRKGQCGNNKGAASVGQPFCIQDNYDKFENVLFKSGCCGYGHTMLISYYPDNTIYGFGNNHCNQTGNCNTKNKEDTEFQLVPFKNCRKDVGLDKEANIVKVVCFGGTTAITVVFCET